MSIYATFDESAGDQLASNRGWGDFVRWTESLDADTFPNVVHLAEYGWVDELPKLAAELTKAIEQHSPEAQGLDKTLAELIELVKANQDKEAIFITDGMKAESEQV